MKRTENGLNTINNGVAQMTFGIENYPEVVSVVNLKGGVGKTTLCVNLAYGLAYFLNKRVLLIDLDPQANATQYLISEGTYRKIYLSGGASKKTILEVYDEFNIANRKTEISPIKDSDKFIQRIFKGSHGYLDLLASKLELSLLAFSSQTLPQYDQVRWFIQSVGHNYDIVLIDCPPTVSSMLLSGFEAAHSVLVPMKPDFLSTIGLPLLHTVMTKMYTKYVNRAEWMNEISMLGLVYTMVDKRLTMTRESKRDIRREAKKFEYNVFDNYMSYSTKFTWSSKLTLPIFRTQPSSRYATEIENLVNEFQDKVKEL